MSYSWPVLPTAYNNKDFESDYRTVMTTYLSNWEDIEVRLNGSNYMKYVWANAAARAAQTGMVAGEYGLQEDTNAVYKYTTSWVFKYYQMPSDPTITGTLTVVGVTTLTAQPILSSLTASQVVFTDASKGLVSNTVTGTGSVVMSADPTFTGKINCGGYDLIKSKTILDQQIAPYYNFKGVDYITVANDIDINFGTGDFSIVFDFNVKNFTTTHYILGKYATAGYLVYIDTNGLFNFWVNDGSPLILQSNTVLTAEKNTIVVVRFEAGVAMTLFIDGIQDTATQTTPSGTLTDASVLQIGTNHALSAGVFFEGNISSIVYFNRLLTASEAISYSSNPQKALDWKDEGGSNVALNVSTCVNDGVTPYDTFDGASATGFHVVYTTSSVQKARTAYEIGWTIGKSYLVTFTATLTSGQAPTVVFRDAEGDDNVDSTINSYTVVAGNSSYVINVDQNATPGAVIFYNTAAAEYTISNLKIVQLGATLALKGEDATDAIWYDSSGNENNGAVTTATRHNKQVALELDHLELDHLYMNDNIVMADGKGIDFSAYTDGSVAGTTTSQLLDDYEEGAWSASSSTVGGSDIVYSEEIYTKVGNKVTWKLKITGTALTLTRNSTVIAGLPYTCWGSSVGTIANGETSSNGVVFILTTNLYPSTITSSTVIILSGTYFVA